MLWLSQQRSIGIRLFSVLTFTTSLLRWLLSHRTTALWGLLASHDISEPCVNVAPIKAPHRPHEHQRRTQEWRDDPEWPPEALHANACVVGLAAGIRERPVELPRRLVVLCTCLACTRRRDSRQHCGCRASRVAPKPEQLRDDAFNQLLHLAQSLEELPDKRMMTFGPIFGDPLGFHHLKIKQLIGHRVVHPIFRWLWKSAAQKKQKVFFLSFFTVHNTTCTTGWKMTRM
jgi:hypothetical protein